MLIRATTQDDVRSSRDTFAQLRPDRWRSTRNARSFVAIEEGSVVGHCLAVDNAFHPDSRVLDLEVVTERRRCGIGGALLQAQLDVSTTPPHLKVDESMTAVRALAATVGAVPIQACPPWRYPVTQELRKWAAEHRGSARAIHADERGPLLDLHVAHYRAQHASWSPAAQPRALRREISADFYVGSAEGFDPVRSAVLTRDGLPVASALVWPYDTMHGGYEVGLETSRYGDPRSRADMEQCLARVIDTSPDGEILLIDSHLTETLEFAMVHDLPGPTRVDDPPSLNSGEWMTILAIPVTGGPVPIRLPRELVPPEAAWIAEF